MYPSTINLESEESEEGGDEPPKPKEVQVSVSSSRTVVTSKSEKGSLSIPGFEWDLSCKEFVKVNNGKEDLEDSNGKYVYMDIAPYLKYSQREAARKLGVPSSTLSKRWKEATMDRKWPYRMIAKIDKDLKSLAPTTTRERFDPNTELAIKILTKRKQEHLRPVFVRLPHAEKASRKSDNNN